MTKVIKTFGNDLVQNGFGRLSDETYSCVHTLIQPLHWRTDLQHYSINVTSHCVNSNVRVCLSSVDRTILYLSMI